ncbi:MAG: ribonuclease P protein component [Candidatus Woykebacteria bacterium]
MLSAKHRLNLSKNRFRTADKSFSSSFFKLLIKKGAGEGPKIGFIVSGKIGKAVTRNRVKRLLSEILAKRIEAIPKDLSLIFIAFPASKDKSYEELEAETEKILNKLSNLSEE